MKNNLKLILQLSILLIVLLIFNSQNINADTFFSIGGSISLITSGVFSGYFEMGFGGSAIILDLGFGSMYYSGYTFSAVKLGASYRYYFSTFEGFYLGFGLGIISISLDSVGVSVTYSSLSAGYRYFFDDNFFGFFLEGALLIYSVPDVGSGIGLYLGFGYSF